MLKLHLLSALLAGLLTHEFVRLLAPLVEKRLTSKGARLVALAALSVLTVALLIVLTLGTLLFSKVILVIARRCLIKRIIFSRMRAPSYRNGLLKICRPMWMP